MKEDILKGLRKGIVKLTHEPGVDEGTVCTIGDHWFYFGGQTAEDMDPEEFMSSIPEEDIAGEILDALEGIRDELGGKDEYLYYASYLREQLASTTSLCEKLFRCLSIAMSRQELNCYLFHIVTALADVMKKPDDSSPILEEWADHFIKKYSPSYLTHRLVMTCPRCGNTGWFIRDDGWECAACGDFSYTEDMGSKAVICMENE